jgi:hypothetical protein
MMNSGRNQIRRQTAGPAPWGACLLPAIPTQGPLASLATEIAMAIGNALAQDITALLNRCNIAGPRSLVVPSEYLEVVIERK